MKIRALTSFPGFHVLTKEEALEQSRKEWNALNAYSKGFQERREQLLQAKKEHKRELTHQRVTRFRAREREKKEGLKPMVWLYNIII